MTFEEWFEKMFPDNDDGAISTIMVKEIARASWQAGYNEGYNDGSYDPRYQRKDLMPG